MDDELFALADSWLTEADGVAHVLECKDYACPTCAVAVCAADLRATLG